MAMSNAPADVSSVSILGRESIKLGFHLTEYIVETVLFQLPSSTYVLITDTNLGKVYLPRFQDAFEAGFAARNSTSSTASKPRFLSYEVAPGEASKSREVKARIEDWLLFNKCTRDSVILALGGGVVGDLTGFVAATFMRGVKYCQIPTTLLAMVDSAVGGKVSSSHALPRNA